MATDTPLRGQCDHLLDAITECAHHEGAVEHIAADLLRAEAAAVAIHPSLALG
jgi:hypothetical protein